MSRPLYKVRLRAVHLASGVGTEEDPRLHGPMLPLYGPRGGLSKSCGGGKGSSGTGGPLAPSLPKPAANGDPCPLCLPTPQIPNLESGPCPQPLGECGWVISPLPNPVQPPASALSRPCSLEPPQVWERGPGPLLRGKPAHG